MFLTTFWVFHSWWWFLRSSSHLWMKAKNKVGNCNTPCLTSRKSRLLAAVVWQQSLSVSAEQLVETVSLAIGVRVADYGGRQKCSWCVYALFLVSDQCHAVIWFKVNAFWAFFSGGGGAIFVDCAYHVEYLEGHRWTDSAEGRQACFTSRLKRLDDSVCYFGVTWHGCTLLQ